jgi:hypothetical protein
MINIYRKRHKVTRIMCIMRNASSIKHGYSNAIRYRPLENPWGNDDVKITLRMHDPEADALHVKLRPHVRFFIETQVH